MKNVAPAAGACATRPRTGTVRVGVLAAADVIKLTPGINNAASKLDRIAIGNHMLLRFMNNSFRRWGSSRGRGFDQLP
jgi:hypothetical protein